MRFDLAQDPHDAIDLAREPAFPLGNLSVRPASREVLNGQQVEALEPRVMQVLVLLARRRGEVVSRDELVTSCWDGRVVGDDAVNRCIGRIRRLSESHGGFEVETIARVGYRLNETGLSETETQKAPPAIAPPVRRWPLRRWQSWSLGLVALVLCLAMIWQLAVQRPATDLSIAVLPFENRSASEDDAYLALGIQDEILTLLTRVGDLRVSSRHSTSRFAGLAIPAREIGRELGVSYLLHGSVQRSGDTVRVHVALLDAEEDENVWAASYERNASEVFAIESEVAQTVARALQVRLTANERTAMTRPPSTNPAAYDAYLRARAFAERTTRTESEIHSAITGYEEAVRLDPAFAAAWAQLSRRNANLYSLGYDRSGSRRRTASHALNKALELQPDLLDVQVAQGYFLIVVEGDMEHAERLYRDLEVRYPTVADVAAGLATILANRGQTERSNDYARRTLALDPMNPYRHAINCDGLTSNRQFDLAMQACNRALELLPGDVGTLALIATIHQARGEIAMAHELLSALVPAIDDWRTLQVMNRQHLLEGNFAGARTLLRKHLQDPAALGTRRGVVRRWLGDNLRLAGDIDEARATYALARVDLEDELTRQPENPLFLAELAIVRARLGDRDQALALAQRCQPLAEQSRRHEYRTACRMARLHTELAAGNSAAAANLLTDALRLSEGSPPLTPELLRADPEFAALRDRPEFRN